VIHQDKCCVFGGEGILRADLITRCIYSVLAYWRVSVSVDDQAARTAFVGNAGSSREEGRELRTIGATFVPSSSIARNILA